MAWNETKKRGMLKAWWGTATGQSEPKEAAKLREELKACRTRLFNRFSQLQDGGELADLFLRISELQLAFAFYQGFRRGYNVRDGLEKLRSRTQEDDAKARIADLCIKHPDWSTKQILAALDDENVPLIFIGSIHQQKKRRAKPKYWWEVAADGAYKMLVSRVKDKMQSEARLKGWEKIMKRHAKLRRGEP